MKQIAIALTLVSAGTMGLAHSSHAMSLPTPSALKEAVPSQTAQVFWRGGGGWGPAIGLGIAAGAFTAAAVASRPYWGGGYWGGYPGYGYPGYAYAPAYDYGYDDAPAYSYAYGPGYGYAPAPYSYGYGPAYAYGTTYVRPRIGYAYSRTGARVRYANTWGSGPRYRATGSMRTARVAHRRR